MMRAHLCVRPALMEVSATSRSTRDADAIVQPMLERMLVVTARVAAVLIGVAVLSDIPLLLETRSPIHLVTDVFGLGAVLVCALHPRISLSTRTWLLIAAALVQGTYWNVASGLPSTGRTYLVAAPLLAATFMGKRATMLAGTLALSSWGITALAFATGWLAVPQGILGRLDSPSTLLTSWAALAVVTVGLSMVVAQLTSRLRLSLILAHETQAELGALNTLLEDRIAERTAELERSEHLLRETQRIARIGGWRFDDASGQLTLTREALEIYRLDVAPTAEGLLGLLGDEGRRTFLAAARAARHSTPAQLELPYRTPKEDEERWVRVAIYPDARDGEIVGLYGAVQDVTTERRRAVQLADENVRLHDAASRDALTGLYNRRFLDGWLPRALRRSLDRGAALSVVLLDVDHFKAFNDTWGHDAGDAVLRAVGAFLERSTRTEDIAVRYGGEEFLVVLENTREDVAIARADAIRGGIAELTVAVDGTRTAPIRVSCGVATAPADAIEASALVTAADRALYRAKHDGRNRVGTASGRIVSHVPR